MPFLKDLYNGVDTFNYYYGGKGNFTQTSLPYGNDIRGGGDSGQPYVQVGIDPPAQFDQFDGGLIRGGFLNTALAVFRDEVRLGKFLTDINVQNGVKGPLFLTKQIGLNRSNPQFENLGNSTSDERTYNREYNIASVNLNAASSPFGIHFDQNGLLVNDTSYAGDYGSKNPGIAAQNMTTFDSGDRKANRLVTYFDNMSNEPGDFVIRSQNGGSDSLYGIGSTVINRVRNTGPLNDATTDKDGFNDSGNYAFSYSKINNFNSDWDNLFNTSQPLLPNSSQDNFNKDFKDFRSTYTAGTAADYPAYNVENRIGVSTNKNLAYKNNPGENTYNWQSQKGAVDSINTINITKAGTFYNNSGTATSAQKPELFQNGTDYKDKLSGFFGRDIIKFRIEVNNNDKPGVNNNEVLAFRAYLNSMDDDFEAKWNEYRYMGRGEPFYVYEGYSRDISLSFTVFAHTPEEMAPVWNKINYLASSLTPDYSDRLLMRGNYHYLTIGDYVYRQPGVITSLRLSNFLDHNWEIALNEPEQRDSGVGTDNRQLEMPKSFVVGMSFKPIHTFVPRRNTIDKYTAPFFTPDIKAYNGYGGYNITNNYNTTDENGLIVQNAETIRKNKYLPIQYTSDKKQTPTREIDFNSEAARQATQDLGI
jgi:hypothetical protein